jgi:leader peptidase (prepilin peptidase)/N-methyltransferase
MMLAAQVSTGLQAAAAVIGMMGGLVAVVVARLIPLRMGVDDRPRGNLWWGTAVAAGALFGWLVAPVAGQWALLPAFVVFGTATLALALIDLDHQLIPNRVLFPALGLGAGFLVAGAIIAGSAGQLERGVLGAIGYFLFLLVVALIARGGFGMGDVKLALFLGLFLGYLGWDALVVGFVTAILLGGVASILVMVLTSKGKGSKFAYGPYLVAGAWLGVLWGSEIADWYLG